MIDCRGLGRAFRFLALALSLSLAPLASAQAAEEVEVELRRISQELLDAVAPGERSVWARYLHPRFLQVDENGVVRGREEVLEAISPLPPGLVGRIAIDSFRVERVGETVVVALELQEHLDYHGQILRSRFRSMDTWVRDGEEWKLIGQHVAAVLKDPPGIDLPRHELCAYAGRYALTAEIETVITCGEDELVAERTGRPAAHYRAEIRDVFFEPGRPRTRRIFLRDAEGRIDAFVDRREGEDVRWRRVGDVPTTSGPAEAARPSDS